MPPPKTLKELKSLQGKLAYIRHFISNLAGRCQPFSHLMKKDIEFVWDQACQNAFDSIKELLKQPLVRKKELLPYCRKAQQLLEHFYHVEIKHVPRSENARADALASLAAALSRPNRSPLQENYRVISAKVEEDGTVRDHHSLQGIHEYSSEKYRKLSILQEH
ncbi:uncharacterized protein LOC131220025 [Magnolia sinica]|uniref:uncharacterized protein LOC131220025 n=1 Tax=Magnolia sinica TaxID=86752 RepID=UPI00265A592F|nr:uncharacterized protein LOC131220025 [Magnolia sinica]